MLTNLLAVFVVILLTCPSGAFAKDSEQVTDRVDARLSKGAKDKSSKGSGDSNSVSKIEKVEEGPADEEVEPTVGGDRCPLPPSQEDDNARVLTARLKGSLCVSCLFQLEKKIQALEGVKSARVIRPEKRVEPNGDDERAHAQIQIIYLTSKLNPKKIRKFVERNDFGIRDENDVALTDDFKPLPDPFENERPTKVIDAQYK